MGWISPDLHYLPLAVIVPTGFYCASIGFLPESSTFLLERGCENLAEANLTRLWGNNLEAQREIESLKKQLEKETKFEFNAKNAKAILKMCIIMAFVSLSGCDTIYNYSLIIADISGIKFNGNLLSILLQIGFILGFLTSPPLIKSFKRKTLMNISGLILSICLILLAVGISEKSSSISVISVLIYAFGYGSGIGSVPYTLLGEILPESARNVGTSMALFTRYFSVFLLLKSFPISVEAIGLPLLFILHSVCAFLGVLFVHFCIEETK